MLTNRCATVLALWRGWSLQLEELARIVKRSAGLLKVRLMKGWLEMPGVPVAHRALHRCCAGARFADVKVGRITLDIAPALVMLDVDRRL